MDRHKETSINTSKDEEVPSVSVEDYSFRQMVMPSPMGTCIYK